MEQKDIYVRLQEIFRDRKVALDQSLANIEQNYEHIVQVAKLELNVLLHNSKKKFEFVGRIFALENNNTIIEFRRHQLN